MDRITQILAQAHSMRGPEPEDPRAALHAAWEGLIEAIHARDAASCCDWDQKISAIHRDMDEADDEPPTE